MTDEEFFDLVEETVESFGLAIVNTFIPKANDNPAAHRGRAAKAWEEFAENFGNIIREVNSHDA